MYFSKVYFSKCIIAKCNQLVCLLSFAVEFSHPVVKYINLICKKACNEMFWIGNDFGESPKINPFSVLVATSTSCCDMMMIIMTKILTTTLMIIISDPCCALKFYPEVEACVKVRYTNDSDNY